MNDKIGIIIACLILWTAAYLFGAQLAKDITGDHKCEICVDYVVNSQ